MTEPENVNGQWWTRIQLPPNVYAEIQRGGVGHQQSLCVYSPDEAAIRALLRDWAALPFIEFDPPAVKS